jgi:Skp family chaperone for outer membrane proteins
MRVRSLVAAIAVSGLMSFQLLAQAPQTQPQQAQPTANAATSAVPRTVGVIDVGYILQNHPTLKNKMESIKAAMEAADKEMQEKRERIVKAMEQLKERFNEGTPDYDRAEKDIADQDTKFRLELVKKRKEFESQQALVLAEVHSQITTLLEYVSKNYGFQVVLQVSRQTVDAKKPETLDMAMSQNVLYFNPGTDVTEFVLGQLQKQLGGGAPPPTPNPNPIRGAVAPAGTLNR